MDKKENLLREFESMSLEDPVSKLFSGGKKGTVIANTGSDKSSSGTIHKFENKTVYCKDLPLGPNGEIEAFLYKVFYFLEFTARVEILKSKTSENLRVCVEHIGEYFGGFIKPLRSTDVLALDCLNEQVMEFTIWSALFNISDGILDRTGRNYSVLDKSNIIYEEENKKECPMKLATFDFAYLPKSYTFYEDLKKSECNLKKFIFDNQEKYAKVDVEEKINLPEILKIELLLKAISKVFKTDINNVIEHALEETISVTGILQSVIDYIEELQTRYRLIKEDCEDFIE